VSALGEAFQYHYGFATFGVPPESEALSEGVAYWCDHCVTAYHGLNLLLNYPLPESNAFQDRSA
jgi:hypothetical protein